MRHDHEQLAKQLPPPDALAEYRAELHRLVGLLLVDAATTKELARAMGKRAEHIERMIRDLPHTSGTARNFAGVDLVVMHAGQIAIAEAVAEILAKEQQT